MLVLRLLKVCLSLNYLIQQHLEEMGIDDEYTVADVTTPLSEEQLAYVDDLETFVILFGNEICYEAPVYEQIAYYIEAAENAIGRKYMFRNAPAVIFGAYCFTPS